ncbi:MAG: glycosyltransferase family 4 protein [Bacteroidota bacterium]
MRLAYFTNTYPRATDTFIQREVTGLRQQGFEVLTFSVRKSGTDHDVGPEVRAEKQNTFYILPVNPLHLLFLNLAAIVSRPARYLGALRLALSTARPGWSGLIYQMFYFQEAVILARAMRRQNIEHLHNHFGDASGTVAMLASALAGIGYSITIHGPHIFFDPGNWALREKTQYSRFIVCISHYCKSQMMLFSDQSAWNRFHVVHCGVDPDRFHYVAVKPIARKLLYIGRLAVEKGLPVLFESLRLLHEQGYDWELTLVGDGNERPLLETMVRQMGIAERVVFAGYANQEEIRDHLLQHDIFILPSFAEGVPVSLMEALACGIPVIATYVGGVTELVETGETGLMVSPSDPIALRDAIAKYLENYELRAKVSRNGRQQVVANFNLQSELRKLAGLFTMQLVKVDRHG